MDRVHSLLSLPFAEAAEKWLADRQSFGRIIRDTTAACYKDYIARLKAFRSREGEKEVPLPPLSEIHIGHFHAYQAQHRKRYHASSVNHDLNLLAQMLSTCGLWQAIRDHYEPLPLPEHDPPKVMTETEEERFFEFAFERGEEERWELAYCVASLTNNTTASGKELRLLQLRAIHLDAQPAHFWVPKNMKTPTRQRPVPMNAQAITVMLRLMKEAARRGSTRPEHFLFPFRVKRNFFDPTRPATESWLKAQWKKLVDAAFAAGIISFKVKPHNLRHQAITNLLDSGVPIEVVRQIAGHGVDSLVTRLYHHGRMEVMARALDTIDPERKRPRPSRNGSGSSKHTGGDAA